MTSVRTRPRWFFLITPRWLAWHAFAVVAFWGMLWLGDWQFHRAESGNALSWAYTFEWPVFAVMGACFWGKTVYDGLFPRASAQPVSVNLPEGSERGAAGLREAAAMELYDPELADYNAYLARLNAQAQASRE